MKILIIGAGWYGCHLATCLINKGIDIIIIDKTNDIFKGSSSKNQNRLHLGFHYPRSDNTIIECIKGYNKFNKLYNNLCGDIENNLYFISSDNSYIDINKYINKMLGYNNDISEYISELPIHIENIQYPIIKVKEKYINPFKSSEYFKNILKPYFKVINNNDIFNSIDNIIKELNDNFDLIINCTYNRLNPIIFDCYELFVTLLYKIDNPNTFAYTIMDGPFLSIYPYGIDNNIYTVTSVTHGVYYKGKELNTEFDDNMIDNIKSNIEELIIKYIPQWKEIALYISYYTSWKTKHDYIKDDRSVQYTYQNNILNIYGGKITGIFEAEDIMKSILKV